jgi:hypothetical protein
MPTAGALLGDRLMKSHKRRIFFGLLQGGQPSPRGIDRLNLILKNDLLRWMRELLCCQPASVDFCPILSIREATTVTKQKGQQLSAFYLEISHRRFSGAGQIPYRLMDGIRHPDRAKLSSSQQFDQGHRMAAVGFDAVASAFGNHRWRNDITNVA